MARLKRKTGDLLHVSEDFRMSVKAMVAEHIVEFTGDTSLDFRWEGRTADLREIPNLFSGRVVRAYNLTPKMRRVAIAIDDGIERLMTGGLHIRILMVPDQKRAPVWSQAPDELTRRVYTIRSGDISRGGDPCRFRHA